MPQTVTVSVLECDCPDATPSLRGVVNTGTQSFGGDKTILGALSVEAVASAGVNEQVLMVGVSDSDSSFSVRNGTTADGQFLPSFIGEILDGEAHALSFQGLIPAADDSGTNPVLVFVASRNGAGSAVATRHLMAWRNFTTTVMLLTKDGFLGLGSITPTEQLGVAGNFQYQVASGSDWDLKCKSQFGPVLRFRPNGAAGGVANRYTEFGKVDNANSYTSLTRMDLERGAWHIGGVDPQAMLHVAEPTAGNEVLRLETAATNDNPNYRVRQARVATTDNTVTTLQSITLADDSAYQIEARILGRRTGGSAGTAGDSVSLVLIGTFKRSGGGGATLVGVVTIAHVARDNVLVTATLDTSGNDVRVRVTGDTNNNYSWHVTTLLQNLST